MPKYKPIVCLDFDGVIHSYTSGWEGATVISDPPVTHMYEALAAIHDEYYTILCSSRCSIYGGKEAIQRWLDKYDLSQFIDEIVANKPAAMVYIDDRGITFDGDATTLYSKIKKFHPYLEEK